MIFAMRIQLITRNVSNEALVPYVVEMVEAVSVDGKGGAEALAKTTVQQLEQILEMPVHQWTAQTMSTIASQLAFLESITLGHTGVCDALISAKVIPTTIRLINLFADGLAPIDDLSPVIVRKAVSYLRSIHTVMKNSNWITQAVKSGMIPAILKSARVNQETEHSEHAEWMVKDFLPQCVMHALQPPQGDREVLPDHGGQALDANEAALSLLGSHGRTS